MKYSNLVIFTIVAAFFITLIKILIDSQELISNSANFISVILVYLSIAVFLYIPLTKKPEIYIPTKIFYFSWLIWCSINLIRGALMAKDYWDWKFFVFSAISFTFISLVFFVGNNLQLVFKASRFVFRYYFLLGFLLIPVSFATNHELYARLMTPVCYFILFFPFLKSKFKILLIVVVICSILTSLSYRANMIKIGIPVFFLMCYYLRIFVSHRIMKLIHISLFIMPIIFVVLGITGSFNLFQKMSKSEGYTTISPEGRKESFAADTRTGLYDEVLSSVINSGNWIAGESSIGKYKSKHFGLDGENEGRGSSEVGILNIFLYYGIIGVFLYFILLFSVTYQAIYKSNNILIKMLGLLIASRWSLSFIEEYTLFDLNFFFFWFFIGLLTNKLITEMNDSQVKKLIGLI